MHMLFIILYSLVNMYFSLSEVYYNKCVQFEGVMYVLVYQKSWGNVTGAKENNCNVQIGNTSMQLYSNW